MRTFSSSSASLSIVLFFALLAVTTTSLLLAKTSLPVFVSAASTEQQQQRKASSAGVTAASFDLGDDNTKVAFDYFDDVQARGDHARDAKSLAIDCATFDPCPPHGLCLKGTCVCDQEPNKGFWAGSQCKECADGWAGVDCNVECAGGSCNQCNGHGTCSEGISGDGTCECIDADGVGHYTGADCGGCKSGFFGENCDKSCPGADIGFQACYGRGDCISAGPDEGTCTCIDGWDDGRGCIDCNAVSFGPNCELRCAGFDAENGVACSGHGTCFSGTTGNGTCKCDKFWGTFDCSKKCPSSDPTLECSGNGQCFDTVNGNATCQCKTNFAPPSCEFCVADKTGLLCDLNCPLSSLPPYPVCSTYGICTTDNISGSAYCECAHGYASQANKGTGQDNCDITCPGDPPCSGHGNCNKDKSCTCFQDDTNGYWTGTMCDVCSTSHNQSYSANCTLKCPVNAQTKSICSGQGYCAEGLCFCNRGVQAFDYCGTACEVSSPPGSKDFNGDCTQCTCIYCDSRDQFGTNCIYNCPGLTTTDPIVPCNGNGRCAEGMDGTGKCQCYLGYSGSACDKICPSSYNYSCGGTARGFCNYSIDAANSNAEVVHCACYYGFAGPACELSCPRRAGKICNGHGQCSSGYLGTGNCTCDLGWTGVACDVPCMCDTDHGNCDLGVCANYLSTQVCDTCLCYGNFTGLCDVCKPGHQGLNCEGSCVMGVTKKRECECDEWWSTASCDVPCPRDTSGNVCANRGVCPWGNTEPGTCQCQRINNDPAYPPLYYAAACTVECTVEQCKIAGKENPQCNVVSGDCECQDTEDGHWFGATCSECVEGYFGTQCAAACQCSGHGGCDKQTGACQCFQDFGRGFYSGTSCDVCTDGFIGDSCERANVLYTRVQQNLTSATVYDIPPYRRGSAIPDTKVILSDERIDLLYIGSYPMICFNSSVRDPGNIQELYNSSTAPFTGRTRMYSKYPTTYTEPECYDEVAYAFVDGDFIYFLMQPMMQCNLTVRLLKRWRWEDDPKIDPKYLPKKRLDFQAMDVAWQMPQPDLWWDCKGCHEWGNRTTRIVAADSTGNTKLLGTETIDEFNPAVDFVLGIPLAEDDNFFDGGGLLVRVDIAILEGSQKDKAPTAALLPWSFIPMDLAIRPRNPADGTEVSEVIAVSGMMISKTAGDTWQVLTFKVAGTLFDPDPYEFWTTASLRAQVECYPTVEDKSVATRKFIPGDVAPGVDWFGLGLALGFNTPDTSVAAWARPFADIKAAARNGISISFFHHFGEDEFTSVCEPSRWDVTRRKIVSLTTGLVSQFHEPTYVLALADAKVIGAQLQSMVVDEMTHTIHINMLIAGKQSYMVKYLMEGNFTILGIISLSVMSAFTVKLNTKTKPETFATLMVDTHTRLLYAPLNAQTQPRFATFLLYDVLSLEPNLADQRGGTNILVKGHGYQMIADPFARSVDRFAVKCRFAGQLTVPADLDANSGGTIVNCSTLKVSEEDAVTSCEGQTVEVTLYGVSPVSLGRGDIFFTENFVPLRRVQAARIESEAYPPRGPLAGGNWIIFRGTGFVDSPFGRCRFFSNNTEGLRKEVLYSRLYYVNVSAATCQQPAAMFPSPETSFLDVSIDGQLFMEGPPNAIPPIYTIVGGADNISCQTEYFQQAQYPDTVYEVPTFLVDELNHWVGRLDTHNRTICLSTVYEEDIPCDENRYTWRQQGDIFPLWPKCKYNEVMIPGENRTKGNSAYCRTVANGTGNGVIVWNNLTFNEARAGSFRFMFTSDTTMGSFHNLWFAPVTLHILPGKGYSLAISNIQAIVERGDFADAVAFAPAPEVFVVDRIGNILQLTPETKNLEITVTAYYKWDVNGTRGGQKSLSVKKAPDANNVRFTAIFPTFIHGAGHYFRFSSNLPYLSVTTPELRTELCPNPDRAYKVPYTGLCRGCPGAGAVCNGTEVIRVLPGYWRGNSTIDIYKCEAGQFVCLGAMNSAEGSACAEGYLGPMCSLCIPGWGKAGPTECQPCPPISTAVALILTTIIVLILGLTGWTINVLRQPQVTDLSVVMRTIVNHMQATGKLGEFSGTKWSPFVQDSMDTQNSASGLSFSGLSSVSCIISLTGGDYELVFTGYMLLPGISFIMAGMVLCTVRLLKLKPVLQERVRADIIEEVKNMPSARIGLILEQYPWYWVLVTTFSLTMFILYQTLITQATAVLKCEEIVVAPGKTQQYLAVDMSIECTDSGDHKFKTAAYIGAIGYGFGIPSCFVFAYKFMNNRIGNRDLVGQMFMFLIGGYKPQYWYWQAVIMIRKLVLVLVITFVGDNPQLQSYGGMWTMLGALVLQIWHNPNDQDNFNRVETLSLAIITLTLNLGMLYFWEEMPTIIAGLLTAILVLVTLGVFVMFGYFMYEPLKDIIVTKLAMVKDILAKMKEKKVVEEGPKKRTLTEAVGDLDMDDEPAKNMQQNKFQQASRTSNNANFGDFTEMEMSPSGSAHGGGSHGGKLVMDMDDDILGLGTSRQAGLPPSATAASASPAMPILPPSNNAVNWNQMSNMAGYDDL